MSSLIFLSRKLRRIWSFCKHLRKKFHFPFYQFRSSRKRCSRKKVYLKISQNSQENTCTRVSLLIKFKARHVTLFKKSLWHRCFPVSFVKFIKDTFFTEHLRTIPFANSSFIKQTKNVFKVIFRIVFSIILKTRKVLMLTPILKQ